MPTGCLEYVHTLAACAEGPKLGHICCLTHSQPLLDCLSSASDATRTPLLLFAAPLDPKEP